MTSHSDPIHSLLLGIAILLLGSGFLGTLIALRANLEGYSDFTVGFIMSGYFLGYILGTFFMARLICRVGHIRTFSAMAAIAACTVILHGLIVNPIFWWLLRVITGACMIGMYMVIESWLSGQARPAERGKILATYMTVTLLALAISQFLLLIYGTNQLASFAIAAMFMCLALVPIALTPLSAPVAAVTPHISLTKLFTISPLGATGSFATGLGNGAFWALGPVFGQSLGMSTTVIAIFMFTVVCAGALLQYPIGHQSDRRDRRLVLLLICCAGSGAMTAGYVLAEISSLSLIILTALWGGFAFSVYSLCVAHTNDHLTPSEVLEATRNILMLNGIGATIGPVIAGLLMNLWGARTFLIYQGTILGLLALFTLYRMRQSPPVPLNEQTVFVPMARTSPVAVEMDPRTIEEPSSIV